MFFFCGLHIIVTTGRKRINKILFFRFRIFCANCWTCFVHLLEHLAQLHWVDNYVEVFCNFYPYRVCTALIEISLSWYIPLPTNLTLYYDSTVVLVVVVATTFCNSHTIYCTFTYTASGKFVSKRNCKVFLRAKFKVLFYVKTFFLCKVNKHN